MANGGQERFEILVELLGIETMEQRAREGAQAMELLNQKIRQSPVSGGGDFAAAKSLENALFARLEQAQNRINGLEKAYAEFVKTPGGAAALEAYNRPIRTTQAGTPNQNDIRSRNAALQRVGGDFDQLLELRAALLASYSQEAQTSSGLLKARTKREQLEFQLSDYAKDEVALTKLRLDRERALTLLEAEVRQERVAAERESATAARSLARQQARGQAQQSAQEFNRRGNSLLDQPLEYYTQPLNEGIHEPALSQTALAKAQSELASVLARITQIYRKSEAGILDDYTAGQQMASAQRQLTGVTQRLAAANERLASESGGFVSQFQRGFRGAADRPYAEQLGQAVKFSAFYGAAYRLQFALLQTFHDALQEGIAFQQGLSDMALATGRSRGELTSLADNLAQIAAATGQSPGAGVQIGARSIGLYGATNAPLDQQAFIAQLSTNVVGKLQFGTKQDPLTLQQNLASITSAAGLGVNGQVLIANLDAYFSKRFGTTPGDTLEAGAQSASAGIAAGFTPEQIQALAALIISRTGQTSSAVGGYLAQIFTRGGEGALTTSAEALGIQTNGRSLAEIFKDLASLYQEADTQTRTKIAATLGRGKVQSAGIAALENYPEVLQAAQDAQSGKATGALDRSFAARVNNIGGQLAILSSTFKEFARLLGDSGLLSVLGLTIKALQTLLEATNAILEVYDSLPAAIKDFIGALAVAGISLRLFGGGSIAGGASKLFGLGSAAAETRNAQFAARYITATTGAEVGAIGAGSAGAGIAATAAAAAPVAAAAALILGVGSLISTAKKVDAAQQAATTILGQAPALGSSATAYRAQADAVAQVAQQNRDTTKGFLGGVAQALTFGHANDGAQATASQLDTEARRLRQVATDVAARDAANVDPSRKFATFDKTGIEAGLKEIADGGGSAAVQLRALTDAIAGLGKSAAGARGELDKGTVGEYATGIAGGVASALDGLTFADKNNNGENYNEISGSDANKELAKQLTGTKIQKKLQDYLDEKGITNLKDLTALDIGKIANDLSNSVDYGKGDLKGIKDTDKSTIQHLLQDRVYGYLAGVIHDYQSAIDGTAPLSAGVATQIGQELVDRASAVTGARSNVDYAGRIGDVRGLLSKLKQLRARVPDGEDTSQLEVLIQDARESVVQNQINRIEALRKVAVQNAKDQATATKLGKGFVSQELNAVIRGGGSADQLAAVLALAGKNTVIAARNTIRHLITVKRAELAVEEALAQAADILDSVINVFGADVKTNGSAEDRINKLKKDLDHLEGLLDSTKYDTYSESPDDKGSAAASAADKPTAAEIAAAKKAAEAARRGGQIGPARAALAQAQAELAKAKKGTIEYYQALASYYQAQDSLSDAIRSYRHILAELRIDTTDPLAEARLALQVARNKLLSDLKNRKAPDVIAQDRLDLKNAQNAAEATKFDQRLQDVQTAEELGRITHGAYLQYLQSEHNRLASIAHKTRQQQDELNQIDRLLKEANDQLQGQFNIGDIKLPTPYEVRRYLQAQTASYTAGAATANSTTTIYIDGADTAKVKQIIDDTVGKSSRVLTTTTRRN